MKTLTTLFCLLATSAFVLTGCGGGGGGAAATGPTYSGETAPAAITATNAEAIGTKTAEAAEEAIAQNAANDANPFVVGISISQNNADFNLFISDLSRQIASSTQVMANMPAGITISSTDLNFYAGVDIFCGGSVSFPDSFMSSTTLNGTITYSNLCINDPNYNFGQMTINGSVKFTTTADQVTIQYSNFSINDGVDTNTMNMTVTCNTIMTVCSISADYEAADGKVYRVANMTIAGIPPTGPYTVTATFYHPDYGSVTMDASNLIFDCLNGHPSSGTINYTGSNSSGTIIFTNCSTYTGTYTDESLSAGSYNGSWL
ncbi:MAG: hypothetical protein OEY61_11140 [Gammaproteobacteria bacterium]|nr:hypothetical protein [Gammaproteobacteria bacterium]